ncbi:MAG: endonuclease [Bacteroidia bacterium]
MNLSLSMVRFYSVLLFFSLAFTKAFSLGFDSKNHNFGKVNVGELDSVQLSVNLHNQTEVDAQIKIYGNGFMIRQKSKMLKRGGDTTIWVVFKPSQNVTYRGSVFIGTNDIWHSGTDLTGKGSIANNYYNSTFDLWDDALLDELKALTSKNQRSLGYNSARDEMYADLDNVNGKVTCVYTGRTASFNSRGGANSNSFNCEHSWPQSKFCSSESSMQKADIHHLFSTDASSNSRRGNYPFGKVTGSPSWEEGGSKLGGGLFEPRDEQKGATARAMLYMVMRYGDCDGFLGSQENTLRNWHNTYIPKQAEKKRNNGIFDLQRNRNPFVDAPELMDRIIAIEGGKKRTLTASAAIVDQTVETYSKDADSARYIAWIINTGDKDIEIAGIDGGDVIHYWIPKSKLQPGEKVGIRLVLSNPVGGLYNAFVRFTDNSIQGIEVLFEPTLSVLNAIDKEVFLKLDNGFLIVPEQFQNGIITLYDLAGKEILEANHIQAIDLNALRNKILIVNMRKENLNHSTKLILR